MTLNELLNVHPGRPKQSVPEWMLGYFKRRSISFANGLTDLHTHVCWLQSRNFTIDLRLPLEDRQVPVRALADCTLEELQTLANYEGWEALSEWQEPMLSWHSDTSLQLHNRWPEPAELKRFGNCMIEFAPSGAYVEDWRLQPSPAGPLIGLRLQEEREVASGKLRHKGGGLIVCGEYAALVLGRPESLTVPAGVQLRDYVTTLVGDAKRLAEVFAFETSVAHGSLADGYRIALSTQRSRVGRSLLPLDGFEYLPATQHVRQTLEIDGITCERLFVIDTLERELPYPQTTAFAPDAHAWFERESETLTRYAQPA